MASFSIALSGLTAASSDLDVTANNIANADTVGFKESRAEFADVFAAGAVNLNTSAVGEGVRLVDHRAAVHAGQHQHLRIESRSCDQRRRFLHLAGSQQRHGVHAQWAVLRGQERQRRDRHRPGAAGLSAHRHRRIQHRRADGLEFADRAKHAAGHHRGNRDPESCRPVRRRPPAAPSIRPIRPPTINPLRPRCMTRSAIPTRRLFSSRRRPRRVCGTST